MCLSLLVLGRVSGCLTAGEDTGERDESNLRGDGLELPPAVVTIRGGFYTCAAFATGSVLCFGYGDLNDLHGGGRYSWLADPGLVECGILDGAVDCWMFPIDYGGIEQIYELILDGVPAGTDWVVVELSSNNACAMSVIGEVTCWGEAFGPEDGWNSGPFVVPDGTGWQDITMSSDCELCALDRYGRVHCSPTLSPMEAGTCRESPFGEEVYTDIEANRGQLVAIRPDGRVDYFHNASNSGIGTTVGGGYSAVSPRIINACALTASSGVECWGGTGEYGPPDPAAHGLTGTYTDLLLTEDLYVIDGEGQLHWSGDDSREDIMSFWDAVGVPNPDDE